MKGQNRDISEFITKFVEIKFMIVSYKNLSQIPYKTFATQCFFTDHLKHKLVDKPTCRMPSPHRHRLCRH